MSSLMRFQYVIGGELRFLSHLDLVRTFERALRRAHIPVALTEGFHPKPKLSFACPLAVGITSQAEYGDVVLADGLHPQEFACRLNQVFPQGLRIVRAGTTAAKIPALMAVVNGAEYSIELVGDTIPAAVEHIKAAKELLVERTTKNGTRLVDLRPLIFALEAAEGELVLRCAVGAAGNLRPDELLHLLGTEPGDALVERTGLFIRSGDSWLDPMDGIEVTYGN
ncbi:MAG: DUF2344 domain-containing protein [Firmicutes bacterium]|jgi:radical SAM-linked protein|nr:DUF2344 domain-containing protein [Bacillota bacterium]